MILSGEEILKLIKEKKIVISPLLEPDIPDGGNIDIRLGVGFILPKNSYLAHFDPVEVVKNETPVEHFFEKVYRPFSEPLVLNPGEMALGATLEYIKLDKTIYGRLMARSSWGRLGIDISTGQFIRPGHVGCLTLELKNHGRSTIKLYPGMRIGQIVLDESSKFGSLSIESRYDHATGPQFSRLWQDDELRFFGPDLW